MIATASMGNNTAANMPNSPKYTLCTTFHAPSPPITATKKNITDKAKIATPTIRLMFS